jgi:ribosome recycling factor
MEKDFQVVSEAIKNELSKMKLGRLDPIVFREVFVQAYGDTTNVAELSQIVEKNPTTCIVSPYHEDHLIAIQKVPTTL